MVAYNTPNGLAPLTMMLSALIHEIRMIAHRRRVAAFNLALFGMLFTGLVMGETIFATMMFSIIQIEILGVQFSGAAFAMLVPTVIGAAHVRMAHEGGHFTKWWLRKLSGIGILVFALGVSLSIGYSAWLAAEDALSAVTTATTGMLGSQKIDVSGGGTSDIAGWIGIIPNSMLFLGLSFGMIITINFASFCLGRALEAFSVLTLTPAISKEVTDLIEALMRKIATLRKLIDADAAARRKLPYDVKMKFAREAAHAGYEVVQIKVAAARRKFRQMNDPLAELMPDPEAETISSSFTTEEDFTRHLTDQFDEIRIHNLLRVLTGIHS